MNLLKNFIKLKDEKIKLADSYEVNQNYEMSYMALWAVTEHTVKEVEETRKIKKLKQSIQVWHHYFEHETKSKRPASIKSFVCEVKNIPDIKLIQESLGEIAAIAKLLRTQAKSGSTKYRDKRNAIAHHAEKFKNFTVYQDYKDTALAAISEIEARLTVIEVK